MYDFNYYIIIINFDYITKINCDAMFDISIKKNTRYEPYECYLFISGLFNTETQRECDSNQDNNNKLKTLKVEKMIFWVM